MRIDQPSPKPARPDPRLCPERFAELDRLIAAGKGDRCQCGAMTRTRAAVRRHLCSGAASAPEGPGGDPRR